jgi:hypothetical protein
MTKQTELFELEKNIWTADDFEKMGWHDANIYGLTIEEIEDNLTADLLLDIDYIFKWVHPVPPAEKFTFWVAPCTLIFKMTFDLHLEFDSGFLSSMEIADLHLKSKSEGEGNKIIYEWEIELQQGQITFKSCGLEQIIRKQPIHAQRQVLSMEERGGINFSRKPF